LTQYAIRKTKATHKLVNTMLAEKYSTRRTLLFGKLSDGIIQKNSRSRPIGIARKLHGTCSSSVLRFWRVNTQELRCKNTKAAACWACFYSITWQAHISLTAYDNTTQHSYFYPGRKSDYNILSFIWTVARSSLVAIHWVDVLLQWIATTRLHIIFPCSWDPCQVEELLPCLHLSHCAGAVGASALSLDHPVAVSRYI
jgi:hypothetical protein